MYSASYPLPHEKTVGEGSAKTLFFLNHNVIKQSIDIHSRAMDHDLSTHIPAIFSMVGSQLTVRVLQPL